MSEHSILTPAEEAITAIPDPYVLLAAAILAALGIALVLWQAHDGRFR